MWAASIGLLRAAVASAVFATWNQLDKAASFVLSNNNKTVAMTPTVGQARGTIGKSVGKWYWECVVGVDVVGPIVGVATAASDLNNYTGADGASRGYYSNGQKYSGGTGFSYGAAYIVGDVIGVALDMDAGTITFYKNGVSQGVAFTGLTGTFFPAVGQSGANSPTVTANFGASVFTHTPPTGHIGLSN